MFEFHHIMLYHGKLTSVCPIPVHRKVNRLLKIARLVWAPHAHSWPLPFWTHQRRYVYRVYFVTFDRTMVTSHNPLPSHNILISSLGRGQEFKLYCVRSSPHLSHTQVHSTSPGPRLGYAVLTSYVTRSSIPNSRHMQRLNYCRSMYQ